MLPQCMSAITWVREEEWVEVRAGIRSHESQDYTDKLEGAFHVDGSRVVVGGVGFIGIVPVETDIERGVAV